MIYIRSPYSSPIPAVREDRAYEAGAFAAHCVKRGYVVYNSVASWHHLAKEHSLPTDFYFWQHLNLNILRHCQELWGLRLDGWEESKGYAVEGDFADEIGMTIRNFNGDNFQEEV